MTPRIQRQGGFTIIELMVAMAISMFLISGAFYAFIQQDKAYRAQDQIREMEQTLRAVTDIIVNDVQMTRYGYPDPASATLAQWTSLLPAGAQISTNPEITQGVPATNPDTLKLMGAFDPPVAHLVAKTFKGGGPKSKAYSISSEAGQDWFYDNALGMIGRYSSFRVTAHSSSSLTADGDPLTVGNNKIDRDFDIGTPIDKLKIVTYALDTATLILSRDENEGAGAMPLAENIEDFQVVQNGDQLTITLQMRASREDPDYTHPTEGDHYRRLSRTVTAYIRTPVPT